MKPWPARALFSTACACLIALSAPAASAAPTSESAEPSSGSAQPSGSGSTAASGSASSSPAESAQPEQPAADKPFCDHQPSAVPTVVDPPWTQPMFDVPERIAPYSTGKGVTVAIIDTGVDASHPQLAGKVLTGIDLVQGKPFANQDCAPNGTGLAGLIAGTRLANVGTFGLAPDVQILPIRLVEGPAAGSDPDRAKTPPSLMAKAIDDAVQQHAGVILVGDIYYGYASDELAASVQAALAAGVVIVAGAGDRQPTGVQASYPAPGELTPYPAAYPGVIGVGSIDPDRQKSSTSQIGEYVDLVAPGSDLVAAATVGQSTYGGTSFAAAFVAATAALVLADSQDPIDPQLTGASRTNAVLQRVIGTASPAGGDVDSGYGAGVVDPYRALTEPLSDLAPVPPGDYAPPSRDPAAAAAAKRAKHDGNRSSSIAWATLAGLAALAASAVAISRGRPRRWRAGEVDRRELTLPDPEPEFASGETLFAPRRIE